MNFFFGKKARDRAADEIFAKVQRQIENTYYNVRNLASDVGQSIRKSSEQLRDEFDARQKFDKAVEAEINNRRPDITAQYESEKQIEATDRVFDAICQDKKTYWAIREKLRDLANKILFECAEVLQEPFAMQPEAARNRTISELAYWIEDSIYPASPMKTVDKDLSLVAFKVFDTGLRRIAFKRLAEKLVTSMLPPVQTR